MANGLTDKQHIWLDEYLKCWNATEAGRRAGYVLPRQSGYENLTKPYIQAEISKRLSASAMSADEDLMRLGKQARADIGDFFSVVVDEDTGRAYPRLDWNRVLNGKLSHLIKSITPTRDGWRLELHDTQKALELIGKHHGLFTDKLQIDQNAVFELVFGEDALQTKTEATS